MITILLADDHQMIRQGLRALLEREGDVVIVREAENGHDTVAAAVELRPDLIVMDLRMPELNGIEATRQIIAALPATKVIGLSADSSASTVIAMMCAGASGYVLKHAAFEELALAVRHVMKDQIYLSPPLAGMMINGVVRGNGFEAAGASCALSTREREILQLVAEGLATKQIAMRLDISSKTVETHRRNLMQKLEIESVAELTKYAIREGITSLGLGV